MKMNQLINTKGRTRMRRRRRRRGSLINYSCMESVRIERRMAFFMIDYW